MKILFVTLFILCTAFFVAAEYAIIRSRMSRIEQMVAAGNKKALAVKRIVARLDEYLSACQLGNTLTNLALGWLGESTFEELLHPLFELLHIPSAVEGILSFLIAFLLLTFLEVVIGELVPKMLAIQKAEPLALFLAQPLMIFFKITYPFSWVLNRSARSVMGLFRMKQASGQESTHTEAELRLILSEGYKSGIINPSEFRYVTNIFELDEMVAKSIMVPRKEIVFVPKETTIEAFIRIMEPQVFDLYPVITGADEDSVVGLVDSKEVIADYIHRHKDLNRTIASYIKPVIQVIETISAQDLLLKMQRDNIQMAMLLDEFGGTSGLATIKDIIRKILVEQRNDRGADGLPMVEKADEGRYIINAKMRLEEVNRLLQTKLDEQGIYTIGGWLLSRKVDIREKDRVEEDGYVFLVTDMENRQIKRVEAIKQKLAKQGASQ